MADLVQALPPGHVGMLVGLTAAPPGILRLAPLRMSLQEGVLHEDLAL